jgi:hypothetical protein|tara:strand:- start:26 stop:160 length:135 start_codon:yes stop_codon:yes gene_type:complete
MEILTYHEGLITQLCELRNEIRMTEANLKIMKKGLEQLENIYYD